MIVTSSFFKKEFDVSKAELIGEGNFAQVLITRSRSIGFMTPSTRIPWPFARSTGVWERVRTSRRRRLLMRSCAKWKTKIFSKFMTLWSHKNASGISQNTVKGDLYGTNLIDLGMRLMIAVIIG